jgi:DHA2 family multidrug resistance protein
LLAAVGLVGFVVRQLKTSHPVIDLTVLKSSNLVASNLLTFVVGFGLFGSVYIFPVMVQRIMGYSPTEAGFSLVPGALVAIVVMPIIGRSLGKGVPPILFVMIGMACFILHGYTSSEATAEASRAWFTIPQIFRGLGTACLTVPLINQAMVGLKPQEMPSGIALTNMLRQLGGAFGIATMNTYIAHRHMLHRTDLVSNLQMNDPEMLQRLNAMKQTFISKGFDVFTANNMSYKAMDGIINQNAYMLSYLDGFRLIAIFFLCAIPLMFLLRAKKLDAATAAKVSEESH